MCEHVDKHDQTTVKFIMITIVSIIIIQKAQPVIVYMRHLMYLRGYVHDKTFPDIWHETAIYWQFSAPPLAAT